MTLLVNLSGILLSFSVKASEYRGIKVVPNPTPIIPKKKSTGTVLFDYKFKN